MRSARWRRQTLTPALSPRGKGGGDARRAMLFLNLVVVSGWDSQITRCHERAWEIVEVYLKNSL